MYSKNDFSRLYLALCEDAFKNNHHFRITTMTIVCHLNQQIDIVHLYNQIEDHAIDKKLSKHVNDYTYTKRKKLIKVFYNQMSLSFKDISTKVVKIFKNGRVHITGVSSILDYENTMEYICELISCTNIEMMSPKIIMMNSNVDIGRHIHLQDFIKTMTNRSTRGLIIRYRPEVYPAVTIKIKKTTIQVFRTGQIIISSSSLEEMTLAYSMLPLRSPHKVEPNPSDVTIHGYPFKQWLCVNN